MAPTFEEIDLGSDIETLDEDAAPLPLLEER